MNWINDEDGDLLNLDKAHMICCDYTQEQDDHGVYNKVYCVLTVKINEENFTIGEFSSYDEAMDYLKRNIKRI